MFLEGLKVRLRLGAGMWVISCHRLSLVSLSLVETNCHSDWANNGTAADTHSHTLMGVSIREGRDQCRPEQRQKELMDDRKGWFCPVIVGFKSISGFCRSLKTRLCVVTVWVMGFARNFGKTLRRVSGFFYRFPKVMRRSGRLEVRLLWRSSGECWACVSCWKRTVRQAK